MPDASLSIDGTTVISKTSGNISIDNFNSASGNLTGATFPTGMMTFIKNVNFSGFGSVGDQENWYPTDMSADSAKTLYGNLTATEHASYSKIKIEFTFDMRVNKATHAFVDIRLIRWQGSTTAPGTVSHDGATLYWAQTGVVNGGTETYNPISGSVIDDISGLSGTIYYALQYRNAGGDGNYASTMYAGFYTQAIHQMIFTGIV